MEFLIQYVFLTNEDINYFLREIVKKYIQKDLNDFKFPKYSLPNGNLEEIINLNEKIICKIILCQKCLSCKNARYDLFVYKNN